ncbi:DUF4843 domain-containing protein [Cyclobacterium qasimii]|uniref:DUF4843 domain-containing protein n=2 Tax=Cyclobacterium qasimii TaxID=1350429 RepID=S7VM10_9BACT|nr:DUF4843 domain-containing protein [Cyclobacterium qasimii]EPR70996.1 hypothetical protein ADICYQ_0724 [Cyclobacterium qasimii M12-11B]GEO23671.1 hypothetical protein CQA01_42050 [Cyclobacterium qasimii]
MIKDMQHKVFGFALVLGLLLGTTSCMEESGFTIVWEGLEVEFEEASLPNGTIQKIVTKTSNNQIDQDKVRINLVGRQVNAPVEVELGVDPNSSAIAGVHYRLENNKVTIPANSSFVDVPLEILTGNLASEELPDLILKIIDAGETKISTNYHQVTIEIRLSCPSDLAGTYTTVTVGSFGTVNYQVTITELEPFTYRISDITGGVYSELYGEDDNPAVFSELCGVITMADQADNVFDRAFIKGSGKLNANGTIIISWENEVAELSAVTTLTPTGN